MGALLTDLRFDNRFVRELPGDDNPSPRPRQVLGACYSRVTPTAVQKPHLLALSRDVAELLGLSEEAILEPEESYELVGQTPSVVFTSGAVVEDDGEVKVYYGGADTVQCVATTTLDRLLKACGR